MNHVFRSVLLASCAIAPAAILPVTSAYAQTANRNYSIAPQGMDGALRQFASQSGQDVVFEPSLVAGLKSKGLQGSYDAETALRAIIRGSKLEAYKTSSGFALRGNESAAVTDSDGKRLSSSGEDASSRDPAGISEILVVGSRSHNVDIRRTEDDAQPYVVFNGDEVSQSGVLTVDDFLRRRLPMNATTSNSSSQLQDPSTSGGIDLRGLGTNQTLVLVDGRRVPGISNSGELTQANISGIPTASIERIEVLPSTAGGIYGGSATGGVVNIILKRNYSGLDIEALYGNAFDGGVSQSRLNLTAGKSFNGGSTRVMIAASHSHQNPLLDVERFFSERLNRRIFGASMTAARFSVFGETPTVFSASGSNLTWDDGRPLEAPWALVPEGYAGPGSDNGRGLIGGAGKFPNGRGDAIFSAPTIDSVSGNLQQKLTEGLSAYVDLYWDRSRFSSRRAGSGVARLPADSPNNPFQQDIVVNFVLPVSGLSEAKIETKRAGAGFILTLPHEWRGNLDASWSQSASTNLSHTPILFDQSVVDNFVLTDLANQPIPNLSSAVFESISDSRDAKSTMRDLSGRVSGPLFQVPGGNVTLTSLLEYRREKTNGSVINSSGLFFWYPPASQTARSAYSEVRVPLIGHEQNIPLVHSLELTGSIRRDEYVTTIATPSFIVLPSEGGPFPAVGTVTNNLHSTDYTISGKYDPLPGLTLRASMGTGFLPPKLSQLVSSQFSSPAAFLFGTDPERGGLPLTGDPNTGLVNVVFGGSANVDPERSRSFSYGLIFTPRFAAGLRFSVDVTKIRKRGEIAPLDLQYLIDNAGKFPGRVTRGQLSPDDMQAGYTSGPILALDLSAVNLFETNVRAIDFQLDYTHEWAKFGEWRFYAVATNERNLKRQQSLTDPAFDSVGFADGPLRWRGNFGFDWKLANWKAGLNTQYYHSYTVCSSSEVSLGFCESSLSVLENNGKTVPAQFYSDVYFGYHFERPQALTNTDITLGVQNVFNKTPPFAPGVAGYSLFADPRMRRFTLTLKRHF